MAGQRKKAGILVSGLVDHEMVAGRRFELTTFGLCDLTQLSLRVGLYLHPEERDARHPVSTPSSLFRGLVRYCRTRTAGLGHVRADVCDTYHTYLKCIDLTKTELAIPVVDELATIPLDLWAREHGYAKLQI